MYLLLGSPGDLCCSAVFALLNAGGWPARIVQNPTTGPARFSWWLDTERSVSRLALDGEPPIADDELAGVLVCGAGWLDPTGWDAPDLAYMQAETQAALLAWIWSLRCPVINRYPAETWYRPQLPLLFWRPLIMRCGLPAAEALVSNVEAEARAFAERTAAAGMPGAVYRPMSTDARYLVRSERDWSGVAAMQLRAPVWLTHPHGQPKSVCVAGEAVIWDGEPPREHAVLDSALRRFAAATGLPFVEIVFGDVAGGVCVVAIEHRPRLEHFGAPAQQAIVAGLVELLTGEGKTAAIGRAS